MFFLTPFLFAVESDPADEVETRGNDYFTKRDGKLALLALGVFIVVATPAYIIFKGQSDTSHCRLNFHGIAEAMNSYSSQNDDKFPPLFVTTSDLTMPQLDDKGRPITWATTLVNITGVGRYNPKIPGSPNPFVCPAAPLEQLVKTEGPDGEDLLMSYGMSELIATRSKEDISNLGQTVIVSETANGGSDNTFDPHPLLPGGPGTSPIDGFVIGAPTNDSKNGRLQFPSVTRLAFPNATNGLSDGMTEGRHSQTNFGTKQAIVLTLFADGHVSTLSSTDARNPSHWPKPPDKKLEK